MHADVGVDGGRCGTFSAQAGDDEGVFFGEAVTFEVELFAADDSDRPSKWESDAVGGGGPDGPAFDAPVRSFLFLVARIFLENPEDTLEDLSMEGRLIFLDS